MLNVSKDFNFAIHIQLRPQTDLLPLSLHNHRRRRSAALLWLTPCGFPALLSAAVTVWRTDPLKRNAARGQISLRDERLWRRALMGRGNPWVCGGTRYDKNKRKEGKTKPYLKGTAVIFTGAVISLVCRAPGSCSLGEQSVFFYITPSSAFRFHKK